MTTELQIAGKRIDLFPGDDQRRQVHVSSQEDEYALQAALDARRPLLVRGEPGVGKTQLAQAAAVSLNRAFVSFTVDAMTEPRDLHYWEDAVERLAQAQLSGLSHQHNAVDGQKHAEVAADPMKEAMSKVARENFVRPGPLWWAYQWETAKDKSRGHEEPPQPDPQCCASNGVVLLIDEIDKADSSFPNGLLEALGQRSFSPPGDLSNSITPKIWPMVIITSNEDRRLPDAFIRRCVVYDMLMPEGEEFVDRLVERGAQHFPESTYPAASPAFLEKVGIQVRKDREKLAGKRPLPGQAEYLDLLRALFTRGEQTEAALKQRLDAIGRYFLRKHGEQSEMTVSESAAASAYGQQ